MTDDHKLPVEPETAGNASEVDAGEPERSAERRALEAEVSMKPHFRHALAASDYVKRTTQLNDLQWSDFVIQFGDAVVGTRSGELDLASDMLTAQALTLDSVFTDMLSRSNLNLTQFPEAAERYMRLALKAQAQSRATLEALAKLHQPREQTVKHVHVDNRGGQAVIAENIQTGGMKTENAEQSHGPTYSCTIRPALPGENPSWHAVPVPGVEGKEAVPVARRQRRRADR